MEVKFQIIYGEVKAMLREEWGRNYIIFPQNFNPVVGQTYYNLKVITTRTGEFKYNDKVYHVERAYHPDYDINGDPINKVPDIVERIKTQVKMEIEAEKAFQGSGFESLASIKEYLPIKEEVKLNPNTVKKGELSKGSKIVRPVLLYTTGKKEILNPKFEKTERGSYLIKANYGYEYFTKHYIASNDSKYRHTICFCDGDIPDDWIYFEVKGLTKNGRTAFVRTVTGTEDQLFLHYTL